MSELKLTKTMDIKRKSFFDVVKQNLSLADRPEPITRFTYIGSYKGQKDDLQKSMKNNAREINSEYEKIVFTGLLLVYPRCFVHFLETKEEEIYKHLKFVENIKSVTLQNVVLLPAQYFAYKMYFSDWHTTYVASPPVLLDTIKNIELDEICRQIKSCLFKTYSLCEYLMNHEKINEVLKNLSSMVLHLLPEVTVIEYLLAIKSTVIQNLKVHLQNYNEVPFVHLYNETVWPPVWSFVPRLLYSPVI